MKFLRTTCGVALCGALALSAGCSRPDAGTAEMPPVAQSASVKAAAPLQLSLMQESAPTAPHLGGDSSSTTASPYRVEGDATPGDAAVPPAPPQTADRRLAEGSAVSKILVDLRARRTPGGIVIVLPEHLLFAPGDPDLRSDARATLVALGRAVNHYAPRVVTINGHTDNEGTRADRQTLSEQRAYAVRDYLEEKLEVEPGRITARGLGANRPIARNSRPDGTDDPGGQRRNRRLEVIIENS